MPPLRNERGLRFSGSVMDKTLKFSATLGANIRRSTVLRSSTLQLWSTRTKMHARFQGSSALIPCNSAVLYLLTASPSVVLGSWH